MQRWFRPGLTRFPRRLGSSAGLDLDGSAVRHVRGVFGGRSRGESGRGSGLEFRTEGLSGLRWAQWGVLPRDAFEEVTDPTLLLLLRVSQQQQLFGRGHVVVHLARHNHFLFSVQMVLMALDMAASALERGRRFEDVPQRTGTGLAARREVVQSGDELVALVVDVRQTLAVRHRLHRRLLITFALTFVGVQDLEYPWDFSGVGTVHISLSDRSGMKQLIDVQGHEGVGLLSVGFTVVEKDLLAAHHHILFVPAESLCVLGGK